MRVQNWKAAIFLGYDWHGIWEEPLCIFREAFPLMGEEISNGGHNNHGINLNKVLQRGHFVYLVIVEGAFVVLSMIIECMIIFGCYEQIIHRTICSLRMKILQFFFIVFKRVDIQDQVLEGLIIASLLHNHFRFQSAIFLIKI